MRIKKTIGNEVRSVSRRFDNTFDYFGYERLRERLEIGQ